MMKIAVGSQNPVKIKAVRLAFQTIWPDKQWEVLSTEVTSGVAAQPMSDEEAIRGARNRAKEAINKLSSDWGVGLEGGLQCVAGKYFTCGWAVIVDKNGNEGISSSFRMLVVPAVMQIIEQGIELGVASDIVFAATNSKQKEGYFGLMTKNAVTRTEGYRQAVIVALARFIHFNLF